MEIKILSEHGHSEALLGLGLSYKKSSESLLDYWTPDRYAKMIKVAETLAFKGGGHNKFLESIRVWLYIKAPRYFWSEFDTYRLMTKQSESTMHTLCKEELTQEHFASNIPSVHLRLLNKMVRERSLLAAKHLLPESYLQGRQVCTDYKTLQNIVYQRQDHKLLEWKEFCSSMKKNLKFPYFIFKDYKHDESIL